ncbi:MAG: prolyl oligopeptidase family serine peptidase [Caulobacter sp.]|nr:prolyl oligopeptidase family serine peptidase [Caulobacter sp.]
MKPHFLVHALRAAIVGATLSLAAAPAMAYQAPARPPTALEMGREAAIRSVSISPDGKHIAAITSPDGVKTVISIWRTDAPKEAPKILGAAGQNQIVSLQFIKNERVAVGIRQPYTEGTYKTHLLRLFFVDFDGKNWLSALGGKDQNDFVGAQVIDTLPRDPKNVLVSAQDGIHKVDIYTGKTTRVYARSDKFGGEQADLTGEIRTRQSVDFDNGRVYIAQWIRNPKTNAWEEHFRWYAADREPVEIVGFSKDPDVVYVSSSKGQDKAAIYDYNIQTRKMEPAFAIKLFDATGVIGSTAPNDYGRPLGFTYEADTTQIYWADEKLAALAKGLRKATGVTTQPVTWTDIASGEKSRFSSAEGADVRMSNWSDDMKYAIVVKVGPSQPPEYYLLKDDGSLSLLGKSRPWVNPAVLGDSKLVQYTARDGLVIPAFLTTPKASMYGAGPYPTIVVPHGGPWARDHLDWDGSGWVQYFASRGYAILQPQFRGSQGWGQKLWRAGDKEWGKKMQDDMDDGVKWMIQQKIAAPDRVAMHGYSYGGYSAMATAVRGGNMYQCVVAGAGVAELDFFRKELHDSRILRELQKPTIEGLEPLDETAKATVPVFLYHGDRDTTVPIEQSERFVAAMKKNGKPVKFLKLKDMGHQSNLWMPGQAAEVLEAVESYLRTECGPGGL